MLFFKKTTGFPWVGVCLYHRFPDTFEDKNHRFPVPILFKNHRFPDTFEGKNHRFPDTSICRLFSGSGPMKMGENHRFPVSEKPQVSRYLPKNHRFPVPFHKTCIARIAFRKCIFTKTTGFPIPLCIKSQKSQTVRCARDFTVSLLFWRTCGHQLTFNYVLYILNL